MTIICSNIKRPVDIASHGSGGTARTDSGAREIKGKIIIAERDEMRQMEYVIRMESMDETM